MCTEKAQRKFAATQADGFATAARYDQCQQRRQRNSSTTRLRRFLAKEVSGGDWIARIRTLESMNALASRRPPVITL